MAVGVINIPFPVIERKQRKPLEQQIGGEGGQRRERAADLWASWAF